MTRKISTGTGLALLAGAIVLHAVLPSALARLEPQAEAAWTPVITTTAIEPQQAAGAAGQAPTPNSPVAPTPISIAVVPTPSGGSGVVLFRLWSNGNVDRRMTSSSNGLSYQSGWQPLQNPPGVAP